MVRPVKRTILQRVGNVLFDSGWEIFNVCVSEPGIFELADVETELFNHRLKASNAQMHVCVSEVDLIIVVIVFADKEIRDR